MKVFEGSQTREEYLQIQIARSSSKFQFCKVSAHDVERYWHILSSARARDKGAAPAPGPILCLGTRNGREVDLFRARFFGSPTVWLAIRQLERRGPNAFNSRCPWVEAVGRSCVNDISAKSVIGVELNPQGARSDVWVGSFDEMPEEWGK